MKPVAVVVIAVLVGACGCAREDEAGGLPDACREPAPVFVAALADAPDRVLVAGTPISKCLRGDASTGDVQLVGFRLVEVAQRLGRQEQALALGYLVGAARRGADPGVHSEIVRRVDQEALRFEDSAEFARGERAGRTSG